MPTHITPTDLALYARAQQALAQAQQTAAFIGQHLADTYQLAQQDTVNFGTGEITRAVVEQS